MNHIATETHFAVRQLAPANEYLTDTQLNALRRRSDAIGIGLVAHAWLVIGLSAALVATYPHPAIILLAVMVIGSRQLGLVILMHDAAHGALCRTPALNRKLSQWLCAWPMLADMAVYRHYHLKHHTRTLLENDPDIVLTGHYPISRASLRRKLIRDVTGQSGFAQRKFQIRNALTLPENSSKTRLQHYWRELGPASVANLAIAAACVATGYWWLFFVCWVLPMLTWYQVVLRIRNIAEHAVVRGPDDPFGLARTTHASLIERALVSPYWVNYHLEHHMVMWVPCYRLRMLHQFLIDNGHGPRMLTANGYLSVLKEVTSKDIDENVAGGGGAMGSFGQGYK